MLELLEQRRRRAPTPVGREDGELVEEEFRRLVGMEDLRGGHEARRFPVHVRHHQVVPIVGEEASRELAVHGLVERLVEPPYLCLVACGQSFDDDP
jgi:hypothetical protein